jgi:hypothetical protein
MPAITNEHSCNLHPYTNRTTERIRYTIKLGYF